MAPRKGRESLAEAPPPAASSSSDEDSVDDSGEEGEETHSSSSEDDEINPCPMPEKPSSEKKPPAQKKIEPPKPAESDTESDSDDSDLPPNLKVKPLASKLMEDSSKVKKPGSKAPSAVGKRPATENEKGSAKKVKSDKAESSGVPQDEGKKVLFQRLWSEDDELVILKGMIDYKVKKGSDPMADPDDFLEFIKKSLHFVDANKSQVVNKVQRLKKKYENAKKRKITNPHELKAFELSKQIWGGDGVEHNEIGENHNSGLTASNMKSRASSSKLKASRGGVNGVALEDEKKLESSKKGEEENQVANWVIPRCEREPPLVGFNEGVLKEGMRLLGERERSELTEKWRKHNVAEMEVYLKRLDLIREVAQKTLNALKSAQP